MLLPWLFVIPRLMGIKRWGVSVLALLGAIPLAFLPIGLGWRLLLIWFWLGSPLTFMPFVPATLRFRIGEPIVSEALFDANLPEDAALEQAHDRVVGAIQALVDKAKP